MKKSLFLKFIIAYAILAILFLFAASAMGPQLFQDRIVSSTAESLYSEATQIASQRASQIFSKSASLSDLYTNLKMIATSQNVDIRIIDSSGTELIYTGTALKKDNPDKIPNFDFAAFGPRYYEISDFYGQYSEEQLNVMEGVT